MVKDGIPHSLRPYVWLRLAGAMLKKNTSEVTYKQVKKVSDYNNILLNTQPYKVQGNTYQSRFLTKIEYK